MDKINTLYFKRSSFCLITDQVVLAQTFFLKPQRPNSVNLYVKYVVLDETKETSTYSFSRFLINRKWNSRKYHT